MMLLGKTVCDKLVKNDNEIQAITGNNLPKKPEYLSKIDDLQDILLLMIIISSQV